MMAVNVDGTVLHTADTGQSGGGVTLVFANSLGTDLRVWERLCAALGGGRRMVRYDKAGHGLSALPAPTTIAAHADQLAGLMDRLSVDRAVIVGLSVGGMIAQALATRRPDHVAGLVLCDTGHRIGPPEMWDQRIDAVGERGIEALADGILERWFTDDFRANRPDELALWRAMLTRTPAVGYQAVCAAIRDADLTDTTRRLSVPTLCVVGDQDGATPPALVEDLAGLIDGARLETIAGAGHLPPVEQPEALAAAIARYLEENDLDR